MTRFVVDADEVLYLASEGIKVSSDHELLAPTPLRSQTLSVLHEAVHRGKLPVDVARDRLERVWRMRRDLHRRVRCAHSAAGRRVRDPGPELARSVEGVVATASIDALR